MCLNRFVIYVLDSYNPVSLVPPKAGCPVLLKAAGMLQTRCAQTVQIPFSAASPVLGGVPMGFSPSPFVLPPSSRSKGSPQGQDWLGCLFLVSSFGHAKEERERSRKVILSTFSDLWMTIFSLLTTDKRNEMVGES